MSRRRRFSVEERELQEEEQGLHDDVRRARVVKARAQKDEAKKRKAEEFETFRAMVQEREAVQAKKFELKVENDRLGVFAVKFQNGYRMHVAAKNYQADKMAVVRLQSLARLKKAKQEVTRDYNSVILVQAISRMLLVRVQRKRQNRALLVIQRSYRAYRNRSLMASVIAGVVRTQAQEKALALQKQTALELASAVLIQGLARGFHVRHGNRILKAFAPHVSEITALQNMVRRHLVKSSLLRMQFAAKKVQKRMRCHLMLVAEIRHATLIQGRVRMVQAKRRSREQRKEKKDRDRIRVQYNKMLRRASNAGALSNPRKFALWQRRVQPGVMEKAALAVRISSPLMHRPSPRSKTNVHIRARRCHNRRAGAKHAGKQ